MRPCRCGRRGGLASKISSRTPSVYSRTHTTSPRVCEPLIEVWIPSGLSSYTHVSLRTPHPQAESSEDASVEEVLSEVAELTASGRPRHEAAKRTVEHMKKGLKDEEEDGGGNGNRECVCDGRVDAADWVQCDKCAKWFHCTCVDLTKRKGKAKKVKKWYCPRCRGGFAADGRGR